MWKIHWESMKRIIELEYQDEVSIRYNSNMSRINYFGMNLFDDLLSKFKYWNILASIDGAGEVGEYVRTGLNWEKWFQNMQYARKFTKSRRDLRMDLTMTMPGILGLGEMLEAAEELDVDLLAKRVFGFSPDNLWSPMCLPRDILDRIVDKFFRKYKKKMHKHTYFFSALLDLKKKPTYDQTYSADEYREGLKTGKESVERLDRIRGTDITKILERNEEVLEWWKNI